MTISLDDHVRSPFTGDEREQSADCRRRPKLGGRISGSKHGQPVDLLTILPTSLSAHADCLRTAREIEGVHPERQLSKSNLRSGLAVLVMAVWKEGDKEDPVGHPIASRMPDTVLSGC